jgi:hypothetical protein
MADRIWAASGIHLPKLSNLERDRLAVLRVTVLAVDPTTDKLHVRRLDLVTLLAVVDRITEGPRVDAVMVADKATTTGALFGGTMHVRQNIWRLRVGRCKRQTH